MECGAQAPLFVSEDVIMTNQFDLIIKNGTVVTAADTQICDIGIRDGRIASLSEDLAEADRVIDATGKLVLPGGIDSHCHIDQRSSAGVLTADDFYTGGVSAASGGNTTLIPFAPQGRKESLQAAVDDYHRRAQGKAFIDYAFHMIISDPTPDVLTKELPNLVRTGHTSFKIFLTYDALKLSDREVLEVMAAARREGAFVMAHAENHDCREWLTERLIQAGNTAPSFHGASRPMLVEREATHRLISMAELVDIPIMIVHVSSSDAMEQILWAQNRGIPVYAETCPQYLFLTEDDLDRPGFEGAKFMCSPPMRDESSQEALWWGLDNNILQVFSSDHAPYRFDDPNGKKMHGEDAPFNKIPNGIPGLELRMPLLFSEGVGKERIDLNTFVALTSTNHAKLYGLYPRKGTIVVGSDADIAIWDPDREQTVTTDILHDNMDYTPYEGMELRGWPVITISRGEVVWDNGKIQGKPGRGMFLPR